MLGAGAELEGDALGGAIAKAVADVVAADDQILAVIGAAADQNMDMRVVGVPVVDRDPVELGAEIAFDIRHQLAREGAQVRQLGGVLRRDDEAKMVPVVFAAFGKGALRRRRRTMRRTCGHECHRG